MPMTRFVLSLLLVAAAGSGCTAPRTTPLTMSGLELDTQPGWVSEPPSSDLRTAQYALDDASLVIYYFGDGGGGSIEANIKRWCGQFAQPDGRDSADVAKITTRSLNGLATHTFDLDGRYVAAVTPGADEHYDEPGWSMRAAIIETDAGPYYIKLLGPADDVQRWSHSYDRMLASIGPATVEAKPVDTAIAHP